MLLDKNNLCSYCNVNTKRVETKVVDFIKSKFSEHFESADKIISNECSKRKLI